MSNTMTCPLCCIPIKVDTKGRFVQHGRFISDKRKFAVNSICKKSGKKA